ncbi:MAG: patatin family protein [Dorea sp.]|nr:patatin family protein [Dorea sp.]
MIKATMVLEGGATRGVFTSGVLDYLMEQGLYTSHVIGVSAGACNGVDYVSRQIGRTRDCMIHKEREYSYYYGFRKFIREKSLMDMDMIFDRYPNEYFPFDYDTYFNSEMECEMVTTNCETGQAEYMTERQDKARLMKICRASCSMPLVAPIVNVDGTPYLDGGLADSIPVGRAIELGNKRIIVVLTRNPGYRKKPTSQAVADLYRRAYKKYPELVRVTIRRNYEYNRQIRLVEQLEREGKIFVFSPRIPTVSRIEKDCDALKHFYEHGYQQAKKRHAELQAYLEKWQI